MPDADLCKLSLAQLSQMLQMAEVSPVEVVNATVARIDEEGEGLNVYITVCREESQQAATDAERAIRRGDYLGPLHGVAIGLKDIVDTGGIRTTCGSKVFSERVPEQDAIITERLKAAGAVIVGKHNLYEFACAPHNPLYGTVRNPWDLERDTSGSSSGSAAAVAAYLCYGAIGTDTGGSIRSPASMCGIVGLKQTYGRVSRRGVFPLSWSLDHAGPMTRTVEDAALMLQAIAGYDPKDPSTVDVPVPDYRKALTGDVKGLRAGVPKQYFFEGVEPEVEQAVRKAIQILEGLGMVIEEVPLGHIDYAVASWWGIFASEGAAIHPPYLQDATEDYLELIAPGYFLPATILVKAEQARRLISDEMNDIFRQVDVILTPTSRIVAFKVGGFGVVWERMTDAHRALASFTAPFNLTGHPAISVPCGLSSEGLPIGFQIVGRSFDEETVLKVAHAYEQNTPWHDMSPPVA